VCGPEALVGQPVADEHGEVVLLTRRRRDGDHLVEQIDDVHGHRAGTAAATDTTARSFGRIRPSARGLVSCEVVTLGCTLPGSSTSRRRPAAPRRKTRAD